MTVAATTRKAGPYTGNGITVAFPFSFKVFAGSEVVVTQTDLSSVETVKTLTTDYTVSLNADQDANPGGTVNMVVAPTTGYLITLTSNVTQSQGVTLTNGGGFYPKVISDALDRATILIQQLGEQVGRALTIPVSSSLTVAQYIASIVASAGGIVIPVAVNQGGTGSTTAAAARAALGTDVTQAGLHAAGSKATPVDADELPLLDSASAYALAKLTWANLKATLKTYLDTLYGALASAQTWTKAQRGAYTTLTDAATIALDLSLGNFYKVQLGGNRTLGAATNVVAGQSGEIDVYQDGTGTRTLAYAWMYQFAGGTAPTLSTAKFAKDLLAFVVNFYKSMTVTAITNGANAVVTSVAHTMFSGQKVQFSALSGSTGLATATSYWVTVVDADTFKLSSSLANCVAGTYITTSSGFTSGTLEAATITLSALQAVA